LTLFTRATLNLHPSTIKKPPTIAARKSPGQSAPARCNAVIYTLLGSCRRHGVNPFDYLKDLFTRLPAAKITQIQEFTPAAWARARAGKVVVQAA
jgi:hypothetical protein